MEATSSEQLKTFRDFLANYNKLSEICFAHCIHDFTTRKVGSEESRCALNCAEKYLKMNQRISTRFQVAQTEQEHQMIANDTAAAQVTQSSAL